MSEVSSSALADEFPLRELLCKERAPYRSEAALEQLRAQKHRLFELGPVPPQYRMTGRQQTVLATLFPPDDITGILASCHFATEVFPPAVEFAHRIRFDVPGKSQSDR